MSSITFVAPATAATLTFAIRFADICLRMRDAPRSATTFARLFQQVERDLQHAEQCRKEAVEILNQSPPFVKEWIIDSMNKTCDALEHVDKYLRDSVAGSVEAKNDLPKYTMLLETRFTWVFEKAMLMDEENALKYAHASLLTAINALHMMLLSPHGN